MAETTDTTKADIEDSMFQMRLEELKKMDEGPEKDEAIRQLAQDYEGKEAVIAEELAFAEENLAVGTPEGVTAGNQYVRADPLSHLARGVKNVGGGIKRKQEMDAKRALSDDRTAGVEAFFKSAALRQDPMNAPGAGPQMPSPMNQPGAGPQMPPQGISAPPAGGMGAPTPPAPTPPLPTPQAQQMPMLPSHGQGEMPMLPSHRGQAPTPNPMSTTGGPTAPPRPLPSPRGGGALLGGVGASPTMAQPQPASGIDLNALSEEEKYMLRQLQQRGAGR